MMQVVSRPRQTEISSSLRDTHDFLKMFLSAQGLGSADYVDIIETGSEYILKASLPGIDKSRIGIDVKGRFVRISVLPTESEGAEDNTKYLIRERPQTIFDRSIKLPSEIDAASVKAKYEDGVLTLTLPVRESEKPKVITVE